MGDPGEPPEAVLAALAQAACELWCLIAHPVGKRKRPGKSGYEIEGPEWTASEVDQALGFAQSVECAERISGPAAQTGAAHPAPVGAPLGTRYEDKALGDLVNNLRQARRRNGVFGEAR